MSNKNNNPQQYNNMPQGKQKKPIFKKWWFWVIIVIIAVIIISAFGGNTDYENSSVSDNTQTTAGALAAENEKKEDNVIGDYKCVVKKATLCKDYEGKDAVKIVYDFTNNSKEATSFDIALQDDVYQDGVGLETAILSDDDNVDYGFDVKIKPGVTKEVTKAYILSDTSTELTIEIGEWISFDDSKITTKVKISK